MVRSIIILSLLFICSFCIAQKKADSTLHKKIVLSVYESAKVAANQNMEKEVQKFREDFSKFLQELLSANGIPLDRVSINGDSLKITPTEINAILRPLKPKKK